MSVLDVASRGDVEDMMMVMMILSSDLEISWKSY